MEVIKRILLLLNFQTGEYNIDEHELIVLHHPDVGDKLAVAAELKGQGEKIDMNVKEEIDNLKVTHFCDMKTVYDSMVKLPPMLSLTAMTFIFIYVFE